MWVRPKFPNFLFFFLCLGKDGHKGDAAPSLPAAPAPRVGDGPPNVIPVFPVWRLLRGLCSGGFSGSEMLWILQI